MNPKNRLTALSDVRLVWIAITAVIAGSFSAGAFFANFVGMPEVVRSLSADVRGLACMTAALQDRRDGRYCDLLLSPDTRFFLGGVRGGKVPSEQEVSSTTIVQLPKKEDYHEDGIGN